MFSYRPKRTEIKYKVTIDKNGLETWRHNGQQHREEDKPARIYTNGTKLYYINDQLHRDDDKPAKEFFSGRLEWWFNGHCHRIGGPAILDIEKGYEEWRKHGSLHRLDGPAVIQRGRQNKWYIEGVLYNETAFNNVIFGKELTVAQIEVLLGYRIKIVKG